MSSRAPTPPLAGVTAKPGLPQLGPWKEPRWKVLPCAQRLVRARHPRLPDQPHTGPRSLRNTDA